MNVWRITRPLVASAIFAFVAGIPTGLCSGSETAHSITAPTDRAHDALALEVLSTDATSVRLAWQPELDARSYSVLRDGVFVGRTTSSAGRFTDFGLTPNTSYKYQVITFSPDRRTTSSLVKARTTRTQQIRNDYTILAIAFVTEPDSAIIEDVYLRHRIQFVELASNRSARIHLYQGALIKSTITPSIDHATGRADYVNLVTRRDIPELGGRSIIDLVENGDIDHVWVVKSPVEFGENGFMGFRPIQGDGLVTINTWTPILVYCSRSFFVNAYLPDERSYDAYAHMVEGIMTSVSDGHPETWPRNQRYTTYTPDRTSYATQVNMLNEFERFRLADQWNGTSPVAYASPGNGNAGSSHFPPNSRRDCVDYCYYSPDTWRRYIDSPADDWLSYPKGSGEKRKLNGYDFGAFNNYAEGESSYATTLLRSPENHRSFQISSASFHQWWFAHLPHNAGVTDGRLNNWWPYIFDFNRFNGAAILHKVVGFNNSKSRFKPQHGEYGTETRHDESWGYWNSLNGFSRGGKAAQIRSVSKTDDPKNVVSGHASVLVEIDNTQTLGYLDTGRNDVFYPASKDAKWNLTRLFMVQISIKPDMNALLIYKTNPIIRLYKNGGNRIELVPRIDGKYADMFRYGGIPNADGWFTFDIPITGNATWEKNVIGYIDPLLPDAELQAARAQLEREILSDVNYVEVSIKTGIPNASFSHVLVSYYIDNLRLITR